MEPKFVCHAPEDFRDAIAKFHTDLDVTVRGYDAYFYVPQGHGDITLRDIRNARKLGAEMADSLYSGYFHVSESGGPLLFLVGCNDPLSKLEQCRMMASWFPSAGEVTHLPLATLQGHIDEELLEMDPDDMASLAGIKHDPEDRSKIVVYISNSPGGYRWEPTAPLIRPYTRESFLGAVKSLRQDCITYRRKLLNIGDLLADTWMTPVDYPQHRGRIAWLKSDAHGTGHWATEDLQHGEADVEEAKRVAREYLKRYPNGDARVSVEGATVYLALYDKPAYDETRMESTLKSFYPTYASALVGLGGSYVVRVLPGACVGVPDQIVGFVKHNEDITRVSVIIAPSQFACFSSRSYCRELLGPVTKDTFEAKVREIIRRRR